MANIEYIRASSLNTYLECSAKFMFQNIEKVETGNKPALAFGTSIHKALETNFTQKIESRQDLPLEQIKEVFSNTLDVEFSNVDPLDFEEKPGAYKDSGIELVTKYQKEHAYRIQPALVEKKIEVKFKGYEIGLSGTIDLVDEDGILVDHKTTSKQVTEIPQGYQLQVGGAYPLLYRALTGKKLNGIRVDFLVRKSLKAHYNDVLPIGIEEDEQYFINVFNAVTSGIKNGVFAPNRQHMYCTKRFCKFAEICENRFKGKVRN